MWTIEQLCEKYYQFKLTDGCSASFLDSAKRHLMYFMDWLNNKGFDPAEKKLSDLNSAILSDFRQMLATNLKISTVTANLYINHVRMLLLWSVNIHGLSHPPMGVIRKFRKNRSVKKGHGKKHDRSAISWNELEKLFAVAGVVDTALLLLGLNCGFGNTDIGTLKLCNIDLEAATVSHPRPKTGVERNFYLWPETVDVLRIYIKSYRGKPVNEKVAELVFVGKRGTPLCWEQIDEDGNYKRSDSIKVRFRRLYEKAGLKRPYGRGYYSLRHTHATIIGLGSNDMREVQASLGQVTLTQQEVYRHDRKEKAIIAQKRIRRQLKKTIIPSMVYDKCTQASMSNLAAVIPSDDMFTDRACCPNISDLYYFYLHLK
jgi:integrase